MRGAGIALNGPEGYIVAYRLAEHNLRLGLAVVADSVNPIEITREAWRAVALPGWAFSFSRSNSYVPIRRSTASAWRRAQPISRDSSFPLGAGG